jgi:DNA-binding response OmpR family regulator
VKLLLVEDEPRSARFLPPGPRRHGYDVEREARGDDALRGLAEGRRALVARPPASLLG